MTTGNVNHYFDACPGALAPGKKILTGMVTEPTDPEPRVADNDANLIGSGQHVDLPLKGPSRLCKENSYCFCSKFMPRCCLSPTRMLPPASALDKCHVQCPPADDCRIPSAKNCTGVEANLQLEVACGKRIESLAADHHAETGGFRWGSKPQSPNASFTRRLRNQG